MAARELDQQDQPAGITLDQINRRGDLLSQAAALLAKATTIQQAIDFNNAQKVQPMTSHEVAQAMDQVAAYQQQITSLRSQADSIWASPESAPVDVTKVAASSPAPASASGGVPTDPRAFQQYLNDHGANIDVDGIIGPQTRAAAAAQGIAVPGDTPASSGTSDVPAGPAPTPDTTTGNVAAASGPAPGSDADVMAKFGAYAWALNLPEVGDKLRQAATEGWTPQQLQAAIEQTQWWRTTQASVRSWTEQTNDDPATANAKIEQQKSAIGAQAAKLGVSIDPTRLTQIATDSLRLGWDNTQMQSAIGAEFHYTPGGQTGSIRQAEGSLKAWAQSYLVPLDDSTLSSYEQQIANGTATPDMFKQQFVQHAQSLFPGLAQQINVDNPTQNALAPWRNVISQELGVAPDTVDFTQPKYNRFVNQVDAKTGTATPMSLYDTQRTIRGDDSYGWQYTKNGQDAAFQWQNGFLKAVGAMA